MAGKKGRGEPKNKIRRYHVTKPALRRRRARVLEMHLAGIPPSAIAEELRKTPTFAGTNRTTVWNDIVWWEKQGEIVSVVPEVVTPDIYFDARAAIGIQARKASRRFLVFQDRFDGLVAELEAIDEEHRDADEERRTEIAERREAVEGELGTLQIKIARETRIILSIVETLTDIPRKLGLIIDKAQIGYRDETMEAMLKAIEDAPTSEARKELIRALELFKRAIA